MKKTLKNKTTIKSYNQFKENFNLKKHIYKLTQQELREYIIDKYGAISDDYGNLLIQNGNDTLPLLVAHLDTVHPDYEIDRLEELDNEVVIALDEDGYQCGIGGDDRNGVLIITTLLEQMENINFNIVFTLDEENRRKGAENIGFSLSPQFTLELDRKGNSDVVEAGTYTQYCDTEQFTEKFIELMGKYNYSTANGRLTDLDSLHFFNGGANISVGYYNAHSPNEYIKIDDIYNSYKFVCEILENSDKMRFVAY